MGSPYDKRADLGAFYCKNCGDSVEKCDCDLAELEPATKIQRTEEDIPEVKRSTTPGLKKRDVFVEFQPGQHEEYEDDDMDDPTTEDCLRQLEDDFSAVVSLVYRTESEWKRYLEENSSEMVKKAAMKDKLKAFKMWTITFLNNPPSCTPPFDAWFKETSSSLMK